jgi:hypothetical protein
VPGVAEKSMPLPDVPMTRLPVLTATSPPNLNVKGVELLTQTKSKFAVE